MKKKMMASLLLSTVVLGMAAPVAVQAQDTDSQIATQDAKINEITAAQATAQAQVETLQAQVSALQEEQETLAAESAKLTEESAQLSAEINRLSGDIVSRFEALKAQARSAQVDGSASSYINTILDSKSLADAIGRVTAMREIVTANNRMLAQQKADKEAIAEKQKANQEAINTVDANRQKLEDNAEVLQAQEAELKVAQLNLAAEKATAEDEKNRLLEEKAAAEAAAAAALAQQQAYAAQQAALAQQQQQQAAALAQQQAAAQAQQQQQQVAATPTEPSTTVADEPTNNNTSNGSSTNTGGSVSGGSSSGSSTNNGSNNANYDASSYPVGECTWGVKSQASWVGPYWGNANQWVASAMAEGFSVGTTPQVGSVAVWTGGSFGHVAYVIAVESATNIQVSESNYYGQRYISNKRGWFNPTTTSEGSVYYIYPN